MAIDNLNYMSSGLPAGQQTDKYSSQPGCLKSKNLDIFSSSKSVKATAWSAPVNTSEASIVLVDQTGNLILKTDGGVYDRSSGTEVLVKSGIATNFPVYKISYTGALGTYNNAQWGTERQLISKYENGVLKYFTLFTDRSRYVYSTVEYEILSDDLSTEDLGWNTGVSKTFWDKNGNEEDTYIKFNISNTQGLAYSRLSLKASNSNTEADGHLTLTSIEIKPPKFFYNAENDAIETYSYDTSVYIDITDQLDDANDKTVYYDIPLLPVAGRASGEYEITLNFKVTPGTRGDYTWKFGTLTIQRAGYHDAYNYLPIKDNRYLVGVGEDYWEKGTSFQSLYKWSGTWKWTTSLERVVRYTLAKYMGWTTDVSMDIVSLIVRNEQVYMIGNMDGNGYIIPCDLTGTKGTPFIAYGCAFKGAINIDYLLYLVGEDRDISQLWVFNGQELVAILGGNEDKDTNNLIKTDEQYRFDGKMVEYRGDLILSTSDNRIFQYGQTYGGKGGTFIHQLPSNAVIKDLKINDNNLIVDYSITVNNVTTNYSITYQDDLPTKNYNTEWIAEYPIVLGNHILEKEESDLYASFILPNSSCSLEFWAMANHYHFWTFTSDDNATLSTTTEYKLKGASGTYSLMFLERDGDQYTFRLEGDLPHQTGTDMQITDGNSVVVLNYTSFNHFRKIGTITTDKYLEGDIRFHNLNNKLELPKSHSLQIMVKGKGTANYTPELFALDLVANQRDRG